MENTSTTQEKIVVSSERKGSFWKRYIQTLSPYIYIPTSLILAISILYNFILIDIDEIFNGGYKIGIYVNTLCMSYLAGFIFYFVSTHIPNIVRKEKIREQIDISIMKIIKLGDIFILSNLEKRYRYSFENKYPTDREWETNNATAPKLQDVDWANDLLNLIYQTQREIDKISVVNDLFPEVYDIILPIQNTRLMESYKTLSDELTYGEPREKYTFDPALIKEFLDKIQPLDIYYEENIVIFPTGKQQEAELDI